MNVGSSLVTRQCVVMAIGRGRDLKVHLASDVCGSNDVDRHSLPPLLLPRRTWTDMATCRIDGTLLEIEEGLRKLLFVDQTILSPTR